MANKILLLDIDDTLFNTEKLKKSGDTQFELYDEVHDALSDLAKIATLGILSQGKIAFQRKKLEETNIQAYFHEEHIHIVEVKVDYFKHLVKMYEGKGTVFFVEDRLDTLRIAKETNPKIVAIWMKRGRYGLSQKQHAGFTPDAVLTNLKELVQLVQQY